jgi:hypothetical protein
MPLAAWLTAGGASAAFRSGFGEINLNKMPAGAFNTIITGN